MNDFPKNGWTGFLLICVFAGVTAAACVQLSFTATEPLQSIRLQLYAIMALLISYGGYHHWKAR